MSSTDSGALRTFVLRSCVGLLFAMPAAFVTTGCGTGSMANNASTPSPSAPQGPTVTTAAPGGPALTIPTGKSLTSPVTMSGDGTQVPNVDHVRVTMDGTGGIFDEDSPVFNDRQMFIPNGQHNIGLVAFDVNNNQVGATTTVSVNVTSQSPPPFVFSKLQNSAGWQWCTKDRGKDVCASGLGDATSSQLQNQATPSLSGSSTQFAIGGPTGYSNALWWLSLGGGTLQSQLTYEMDVYVDHGDLSEALEFDVNQSVGGLRYTYGTECSFLNTHKWDVWDSKKLIWVTTKAPCPQLASNQWHHLKWQFERVNNQVHYISVTVDANTYPIDLFFDPQPGWDSSDLNIAFQLDGNYKQAPYNVWLDNMTLTVSE